MLVSHVFLDQCRIANDGASSLCGAVEIANLFAGTSRRATCEKTYNINAASFVQKDIILPISQKHSHYLYLAAS